MKIIIKHLQQAFDLTFDLANAVNYGELKLRLNGLPSNSIGLQFWCITGARESYLKAIINKGWSGFSCSLNDATSKAEVLKCLKKSSEESLSYLNGIELSEIQIEFLLTLLEHEIQHHGQLIRYFYGNKLVFPESWNKRYTV